MFLDLAGIEVLGPYDGGTSFRDGYAGVRIGDAWGVIDTRGTMTVEPRFAALGELGGGLVAVRDGGKVGYLDCATGAWAIEPRFDHALGFRGAYASVVTGGEIPAWARAFQTQPTGGAWGIVDRAGRMVVDMVHGSAHVHDAVAVVNDGGTASGFGDITIGGGTFSYVDLATGARIGDDYASASPMSEGRAWVLHDGNSTTWTLIDQTGTALRAVDLGTSSTPGAYVSGRAVLGLPGETSHRSKYGFVDRDGVIVVDDLGEAHAFEDEMAVVNRGGEKVQGDCRGGTWGFLALDGSFVTRPGWSETRAFSSGRGVVATNTGCLVVDRAGDTVFESAFLVMAYANGLALRRG